MNKLSRVGVDLAKNVSTGKFRLVTKFWDFYVITEGTCANITPK